MSKRKILILCVVLAIFAAGFGILYQMYAPRGAVGEKNLTVKIYIGEEFQAQAEIQTEQAYLGEALREANLIQGETGQFGMFITTVNGIVADDSKQEWWCLTKDGEDVLTGADDTPIADGDIFELTLIVGW